MNKINKSINVLSPKIHILSQSNNDSVQNEIKRLRNKKSGHPPFIYTEKLQEKNVVMMNSGESC